MICEKAKLIHGSLIQTFYSTSEKIYRHTRMSKKSPDFCVKMLKWVFNVNNNNFFLNNLLGIFILKIGLCKFYII